MSFATLNEILTSREERAALQRVLLDIHHFPVLSFTMNIAGPQKNTPLIKRAFLEGVRAILDKVPEHKIAEKIQKDKNTGCELVMSIDTDAHSLKKLCIDIEDTHPLGRLFDIDVITESGAALNRPKERGCLVCSSPGRSCAAGRVHSAQEVSEVANRIMTDFFLKKDIKKIGFLSKQCLFDEVETTPKPGLVDMNNCGSHKDMDLDSFKKSACALTSYFEDCFRIGFETSNMKTDQVVSILKTMGLNAEEEMYKATSGVNTHKGIIYSLGIICASVGRLRTPKKPFADTCDILTTAAEFAKHSSLLPSSRTYQLCHRYNIGSIVSQAQSGFESIAKISLPVYTLLRGRGFSKNDAGAIALIHLIANVDDTNLYHRGGKELAAEAKQSAKALVEKKRTPSTDEMRRLDSDFIAKNLSPGGCADLLAITYFLSDLCAQAEKY